MSRILRRPMFRGGPVSSYGTGIAAPLVPGYKGGGQIGGGIIYGKPMADGRYGFAEPLYPRGMDLLKKNVSSSVWDMTPDQALKMAEAYRMGSDVNYIPTANEVATEEAGKINEVDTTGEEEVVNKGKGSQWEYWDALGEYGEMPMQLEKTPEEIFEDNYNRITKKINEGKYLNERDREFAEKHGLKMYNELFNLKGESIGNQTPIEDAKTVVEKTDTEIVDPKDQLIADLQAQLAAKQEGEMTPEVDAKTMVAENKELFRDLLGYKEAKGQDISDMLLGFAGAEGDDTWSKAKSFFRDEAKRPGKAQKIDETAAALAINDYVAGKRSKENIKQLKAIEDYKPKAKLKATMPSKEDTAQVALYKIAALNDSKIGSDTTLKQFIKLKTGESAIRNDKIKMKDLDNKKKQKKLNIGYNIIEEDQVKNIVYWDGTNYDIVTLEQIWAKE